MKLFNIKAFFQAKPLLMLLFIASIISSCDTLVIPDVGEIEDATPPAADFGYAPADSDWKTINFGNQSISATDYAWDFGDGATSTEANPSHTYAGIGDYTVSLTATDKLNATSTITKTITIAEPIVIFVPEITNPGFDIEDPDSYRDGWRNSDLGGVIQITSGPIHDGVKAAKLPTGGDRIGYQLVTVQENKSYRVSFYYTMKTSPAGTVEVSILGGHVTDPSAISAATLSNVSLNDQTSASDFVAAFVDFNSGSNTEIAIYFTNTGGVESRVDSFTIVEN